MTRKRRWTLVGLGAAIVLLLIVRQMSGSAVEVETARVARDTVEAVVREEGRTRVRDRYVIAAPVTGRLARIAVEEGAMVSGGDVVARISATPEDPRTLGINRA